MPLQLLLLSLGSHEPVRSAKTNAIPLDSDPFFNTESPTSGLRGGAEGEVFTECWGSS